MNTTLLATHHTAVLALAVLPGDVRRRPVTAEISAPRQHQPQRGPEVGVIGHLPGRRVDAPAGIAGTESHCSRRSRPRSGAIGSASSTPLRPVAGATISGHAAVRSVHNGPRHRQRRPCSYRGEKTGADDGSLAVGQSQCPMKPERCRIASGRALDQSQIKAGPAPSSAVRPSAIAPPAVASLVTGSTTFGPAWPSGRMLGERPRTTANVPAARAQ
jgi:hypothetical protein